MAVTAMKRLELYAMKKDRKAILELLQRRGVVDVQATEETAELFSRMDTSQTCQELEQNAQLLEQAAALLDQYVPVKKVCSPCWRDVHSSLRRTMKRPERALRRC